MRDVILLLLGVVAGQVKALEKQIELVTYVDPATPKVITSDSTRLRQVPLKPLQPNAMHHRPPCETPACHRICGVGTALLAPCPDS